MRVLRVILVLVLLAAAVVGAGAYFLRQPFGPTAETFVVIAPGTGKAAIARELEKDGIIRSRYAFEGYAAWRETEATAGPETLKAGEYKFDHPATVREVYDRLARGDVFTITVVVPEGFNLFDIANAVQAAGLGTGAAFLEAAHSNTDLIAQWSPHAPSLEGYLFPDTYKFSRHATDAQIVAAMVKRFTQMATKLGMGDSSPGSENPDSGRPGAVDVANLVTMASLIEKEVHVDAERPKVASVFVNRLAAGMPLQTDPAVIYASELNGTWTGVIHQSELHSDSPYNTYTHKGLPPGPICNPGVAALKAALHPAQTSYLYFVADANGATRFSETLAEHNANVAAYRFSQMPHTDAPPALGPPPSPKVVEKKPVRRKKKR